ncbi:GDSL-type esterase/lipase family protein [Escherichia albertii NBRC 107761 = DSM 17582]|uniref:N-acetylneuraminate cytidylyltransferase n=3 Tax=Escherichia albertii TaxID=208962 RepID=A0A288W4N2_ESCAL|nr:GDSL-type esterase/lipase family protein [Escherichia albertii]ARO72707.1 N-acetylneuraminate cytidylyltransferase [Escherichia albertii]ARO72837.1 N-acetylneuraminate cytidylyltransferase [Escherichia albertii]ATE88577.1 N-acetylneuraminate cytidylyltransferase [Escherichia albertii NBRC 107761 = DSM 17582]ATE88589.1 N-acetylneuraminate cytidylyltransferase [Escherichia albertii]EDS90308.1 N-acylneuraminate cytidylyltransferase [Escherichia albertii TW07627]
MVNRLAIIPARSGSKGLANKNILMLIGKPLIVYTIDAAISSKCFSKVIVSTDSIEYKYIAEKYGAEVVMRDERLASDTATSFMVIEDILKKYRGFDYFVLLQPTSPFRNAKHIQESIDLFESKKGINFLVSVTESNKNSELIKPLDESHRLTNFGGDFSNYRRQNVKEYSPNGAIFIGRNDSYLKKKHFFGSDSVAYIMNKEDSVDIDDRVDFEIAISLATKKMKQKLLIKQIKHRIAEKFNEINPSAPITLIGHSLFDYWGIDTLAGKKVNNYGIAGINSEQYYQFVLKKRLISNLGDIVFLYSGTNDIVLENWTAKYTIYWTTKIIEELKKINSNVKIYLLAVPPVNGRVDRNNYIINELNHLLFHHVKCLNNVYWVPLSESFYDEFGNLKHSFTSDGLHFTKKAYEQLERDLEEVMK